jgi:RNA polymerase sigma-70 factor (ECF subfamily)
MTSFAFPDLEGGAGVPGNLFPGAKIIQRIRPVAGSHPIEATLMADADAELVRQSQRGDPSAFEELVRKHQQMIHALTFRMTGSLADAEDLAQEAFIRAFAQIGSFGGGAKFSTWLYSIAMHACLNWRRNEARRSQAHANCAEEMLAEHAGSKSSASENTAAQSAQAALMKLPTKQRAAIVLTIYDGLNHAQAAHILGCSETTVSWRVFAAKRKLKQLLTARSAEPVGEVERTTRAAIAPNEP